MNRRSFLKILGLGTAGTAAAAITPQMLEGFVTDPERLLWEPGKKTILLPPEKTFSLYSLEDFQALERAMGVLRFYDPRGRERLSRFDAKDPHAVDQLKPLSDQEIRLAIETGHDLAPAWREMEQRMGVYGGSHATQYTDRGHIEIRTLPGTEQLLAEGRDPANYGAHYLHLRDLSAADRKREWGIVRPTQVEIRNHGVRLLDANGRAFSDVVTTESTDRGIVTIGHKDRKGL